MDLFLFLKPLTYQKLGVIEDTSSFLNCSVCFKMEVLCRKDQTVNKDVLIA